jgi:hypothetical protein
MAIYPDGRVVLLDRRGGQEHSNEGRYEDGFIRVPDDTEKVAVLLVGEDVLLMHNPDKPGGLAASWRRIDTVPHEQWIEHAPDASSQPANQPTEPGQAQGGSSAVKGRATAGEEPTTASGDFLRPVKPQDHFEAGELWAMPLPDGRLRISPLRQWSRTGLELRKGQRLEIRAEGYVQGCQRPVDDWAYGPWSPAGGPAKDDPGSRVCALICRIVGETETREFIVGERFRGESAIRGAIGVGCKRRRAF